MLAITGMAFSADSIDTNRSVEDAIEQAHNAIWGKFVDKNGVVLDYVADLPTPEECARSYPNGLGWWTPIENGPMFTGPYLIAQCERARRTGKQEDKDHARTLANGLLKLASASDVSGMIVRGLGSDGKCHYPLGSDDQTQPWFVGLYAYWKSDIATDAEKQAIAAKVKEVADALEDYNWMCPCDGDFQGKFRGGYIGGGFRDAVRLMTMLKIAYEITGDAVWQQRYTERLYEIPNVNGKAVPTGESRTRLQSIMEGYAEDAETLYKGRKGAEGPYITWIYVGAICGLKELADMEESPELKDQYLKALAVCSAEAFPDVGKWSLQFDNNNADVFGLANWRDVFHSWIPQQTVQEAVQASETGDKEKWGKRFNYENKYGRAPLACAVVAAQTEDPAYREVIGKTLRHYDYDKFYTSSPLVYAECAYYMTRKEPLR